MSLEAWGDDGMDGDDYAAERLMEAGWWPSDMAEEVTAAIKALDAERVYEDGKKESGISVRFLMRLTLLKAAAQIDVPEQMVNEAREYFAANPEAK
jgi:hypothetical protein